MLSGVLSALCAAIVDSRHGDAIVVSALLIVAGCAGGTAVMIFRSRRSWGEVDVAAWSESRPAAPEPQSGPLSDRIAQARRLSGGQE
jgi:hypothetical protein